MFMRLRAEPDRAQLSLEMAGATLLPYQALTDPRWHAAQVQQKHLRMFLWQLATFSLIQQKDIGRNV